MICISWHFFLIYILTAPIKFASYWHTRFLNHSQFHFLVKILFDGYLLFSRNIYIYIYFFLSFSIINSLIAEHLSFTLQIFSNCASHESLPRRLTETILLSPSVCNNLGMENERNPTTIQLKRWNHSELWS